jgi:hypothetical protein
MPSPFVVLYRIYDQLASSLSLRVFSFSAICVLTGMLCVVWARAVRLKQMDNMRLDKVEFEHPHLPSSRIIAYQVLCIALLCMTLFTPGMLSERPYEFVAIFGPLLLVLVIAVGTELQSVRARIVGLSLNAGVTLGTAVATFVRANAPGGAVLAALLCGACAWLLALQLQHGKQLRQWPVGGNILLVCSAIGTYFLLSLR